MIDAALSAGARPFQANADSDSEQGSDASSDSAGGVPPGQFALQDGGLSSEEIVRVHDELLALQMQNEELLEERRQLLQQQQQQQSQSAARPASGPSMQSAAEVASAFGQKLSSQMKSNTAAMHAFGVKGMSSMQSSLKQGLASSGADGFGPLSARQNNAEQQFPREELEVLRKEMQSLRDRIRTALEEADEFRAVAADARRVAAHAAQAASDPDPHADLPSAATLRATAADLCQNSAEVASLEDVRDRVLLRIARVALSAGVRRRSDGKEGSTSAALTSGARASKDTGDTPSPADIPDSPTSSAAPEKENAAEDEDHLLLQRKIESQQQELDQLRELLHKQQEQISKCRDQLSGKEDPGAKEAKKQLKEKLKEAERQLGGLQRQLQDNEEESRSSQCIRSQLRDLAEQAVHRDADLATMRSLLEYKRSEATLAEDRLRMAHEDMVALQARRTERRRRTAAREGARLAAEARQRQEWCGHDAGSSAAQCSQGQADPPREWAEAGAQADLLPAGLVALERRARLQTEIGDLRVGMALLEKRTARELRELRLLVGLKDPSSTEPAAPTSEAPAVESASCLEGGATSSQSSSRRDSSRGAKGARAPGAPGSSASPASSPERPRNAMVFDIGSDGEGGGPEIEVEPDSEAEATLSLPLPNLVYIERVGELEERNDGLKSQLAEAHEAERSLRTAIQEKNELVAHLARRAGLTSGRGASIVVGRASETPWRASVGQEESVAELERIIEHTTQDNVRLRNDIQALAEEFRKALEVQS